jgi:hypothetical protein
MVDEWWAEVDTTQNTLLYFSRSYRRKRILEFSTNKFRQYSMPNELVAKIKKHAKVLGAFLIPEHLQQFGKFYFPNLVVCQLLK